MTTRTTAVLGLLGAQRCLAVVAMTAALAVACPAPAQRPPVIGPQVRIDLKGGTFAANETTAALSPVNPLEIIAGWNDWRLSGASEVINSGFAISLDAGSTWTDLLLRPPADAQSLVEGDPMTAWDPRTGTLWAGAISFAPGGPATGVYVARKDPGAAAFEDAVVVHASTAADKCWMAAGPRPGMPDTTRLYVTWSEGVKWSDDLGDTWSGLHGLGSGLGFLPRVGPGGELYIAYWDYGSQHRLLRSLDGGLSFTDHLIATRLDPWGIGGSRFPGTFRVPTLHSLAVDPNDGTLYAVYFDTTNIVDGQANVNLYFTRSVDQGTTWLTPKVINSDATPPGDQFFSWIEVDAESRLHLLFYDTRHVVQDDNVVNGMIDAYYAISVDGGFRWREFRLTPASFDSDNDGLDRSTQFLGDYLGLTVSDDRAYPVYLDTSAGDPDVQTHVIELPLVGDTNGDGIVDALDYLDLIAQWGSCPEPFACTADFNGDGQIDSLDFLALIGHWTF